MSRATNHRRIAGRARSLLLAALLLVAANATALLSSAAARAQSPAENTVTVTVLSIVPPTPGALATPTPLTIVVRLTNTGDDTLSHLSLHIDRGDPIGTQSGLDAAIAKPQPPSAFEDSPVKDVHGNPLALPTSLSAGGTTVMTIKTSSSLENDKGLCVCQLAAIYPLWFSVYDNDPQLGSTVVGTGQSFVPAFFQTPEPVQVSWLWPMLEPPHRLSNGTVFLDDGLASSVSSGRLAHVLQVADTVTAAMPLTLIVDPELIDELVVMSTGYQVQHGTKLVAGTGGPAAAAWLATLRAIVHRPGVELDFTPPADPDTQALTDNGLSWAAELPAAEQQAVQAALGSAGHTDVVWPLGDSLAANALAAVAARGASTVVLDQATLPVASGANTQPDALSPLSTSGGALTAAVTSASIEQYVQPVVSIHGAGMSQLPELVSEVAIRAVEDPTQSHYVVITPPREVDPAPAVAAAAILATADTTWAKPLGLATATAKVTPVPRAPLAASAGSPQALPEALLDNVKQLQRWQPALASMLPASEVDSQLGWIPGAVQNLQSSAWSLDPTTGIARSAAALLKLVPLQKGAYIVPPSSGAYTLGSSNAPLPLTVQNTLPFAVKVDVKVSADGSGAVGLSTHTVHETIQPHTKLSLRVPTHVERTGRFAVLAGLYTPAPPQQGLPLGKPVPLTVHSTVLGTIGVIITIVAGAVLALALIVRLIRRLRRRGPRPPVPPELAAIPQ